MKLSRYWLSREGAKAPTLYKRIAFFKLIVNIKSVRGGVQMATLSLVVDVLTAIADIVIIVIIVKSMKNK